MVLDVLRAELRAKLLAFMDEYVYPAEAVAEEQRAELASPWDTPAVVGELKAEARSARGPNPQPSASATSASQLRA